MAETYDIEPTIEHYGCMVDFYGRAGQLRKAYNFVVQMPVPPNAVIWRTLLGACSFLGDIEMAEQVNKRLSELDPDNCGDHVLLSSIYTFAGKWKDVAMVRRSMAEKDMKKIPGWSMIEIDKVMYSFVAGDKQNEITEEAYNKLSEIMLKLKVKGGYIPEVGSVLHDIEEEEKEDTVSKHSEKLAVAFGMARLCKGSTIRIVKNLRVCKDCHSFMKLISKVYGLEIVVTAVNVPSILIEELNDTVLCNRRSGPGTIKTIIERLSIGSPKRSKAAMKALRETIRGEQLC
uniref:Pentatricopeptide repeat-containing protein n=1 Tax=Solanum tuberosum TaxID=4113 RepID=M0ZR39_SOLTU